VPPSRQAVERLAVEPSSVERRGVLASSRRADQPSSGLPPSRQAVERLAVEPSSVEPSSVEASWRRSVEASSVEASKRLATVASSRPGVQASRRRAVERQASRRRGVEASSVEASSVEAVNSRLSNDVRAGSINNFFVLGIVLTSYRCILKPTVGTNPGSGDN
jgi:hypothetical protein